MEKNIELYVPQPNLQPNTASKTFGWVLILVSCFPTPHDHTKEHYKFMFETIHIRMFTWKLKNPPTTPPKLHSI